jgi:copper(I)-binding protein
MRPACFAVLAAMLLGGCQPSAPDTATVTDAWVRLPAVAGRPAAAYFTMAGGSKPDRLIAISSDKATKIELHESMTGGGMASMKPLRGVDMPAGGSIVFAPGGNHAMLYGVDPALKPGDALPLQFRLQSGKAITAEAKTVAAGDAMPEHGAH